MPDEDIILESKSTNSAENILFTREKLKEEGIVVQRLLGVHKPFMERRLYAAMKVYWPEMDEVITSPQLNLEEYIRNSVAQGLPEKTIMDVLVGDFQRMDLYAKRGYQIPQEIPESAWEAFHRLVARGYTSELVKE